MPRIDADDADVFRVFAFRLHLRREERHVARRLEVTRLLREDPSKLRAGDVVVSLRVGREGLPFIVCPFTDVPDSMSITWARHMFGPMTDARKLEIAIATLEDVARKRRGQTVQRTRAVARAALDRMSKQTGRAEEWKALDAGGQPLEFDPAHDRWFAPSFVEAIVTLVGRDPEEWVAWKTSGEAE